MRASRILKIYYGVTFLIGLVLTVPLAYLVKIDEIGGKGAAVLILSWNALFVLLLPMILDWAESRYLQARFVAVEEVAKTNPELAQLISEQCEKLSIPGLRFAVVESETANDELFAYGLWRANPRLVVPGSVLANTEKSKLLPSVEAELNRFASQDHTLLFILFAIVQVIVQNIIVAVK